ncbi:mechanosensitive ion channel family protein [Thalassobacillus pellis]|uniref:mechanosensitive ion channel family protein n=1 Tax=Thalassobacillus pellis TaxID=748008 RepID=UPI0019613AC3|nr:mechanosensitive ion channel family protein [Thalassobacillus pellis]MBM7552190.1 small conductance mechanosensitive channel [Thalassobacillus pellis]
MDIIQDQWEKTSEYIFGPELWVITGKGFLKILLILLISYAIVKLAKKGVNQFFRRRRRGPFSIPRRREDTLVKLVVNTLTYIVYFSAFIMILEVFGLKIGPLLAGAGVAGLAIGFGAQNLVRDVITGFFIIFEDQFSVGDYVKTSGVEGFVEEIGLRTSKIKSWTGELNIIPNGSITQVTNYSIHNSIAVVDVRIAYEGDIDRAEKIIAELLDEMPEKYEDLIATPELLGVQALGTSEVIMRVIAETYPMQHWMIGRMLRKEIKTRLDERGIEIPFPRIVMYSRHDQEKDQKVEV